MKSTLLTPEQETFPDRYRWTVESCHRLMEAGFLNGRFEVLDGEVVNKIGQNPPHRISIILIAEILFALFGVRRVQTEKPITLPAPDGVWSEPEPDIAVTREPTTAYSNRNPGSGDLLLIVEVSDATLRTDLLVKARVCQSIYC